jgi:hypothetical protein
VAIYSRDREVGRWSGRATAIVQAAAIAWDTLSDWTGEQLDVSLNADLAGQKLHSTDPEDLKALFQRDLDTIKEINLSIGSITRAPNVRIQLSSDWAGGGLKINVRGEDEQRVRGLMAHLSEILVGRPTFLDRYDRWLVLAIGLPLITVIIAVVAAFLDPAPNDGKLQISILLVGGWGLLVALLLAVWWLTPPLELIGPSGRTRWARSRAWLAAGTGTIVLGVIAAILAQPFE